MENREEPNLSLHREAMISMYRFVPFCAYVCMPSSKKYQYAHIGLWRFHARCLTNHHILMNIIYESGSMEQFSAISVANSSSAAHAWLTIGKNASLSAAPAAHEKAHPHPPSRYAPCARVF